MSVIVQKIVDEIMQEIEKGHLREPDRHTVSYSFTLTEPEEVSVGPEIYKLFDQRLRSFFKGAKITSKGYAASGYNIVARVDK